jgi:hypothetical protein
MPRGAKPRTYDADVVSRVRSLYDQGRTQAEIALDTGTSQRFVWRLMRNCGIKARIAAKRRQSGSANSSWKGDAAGYKALHLRVAMSRGKPSLCEECGTTSARRYEWASISGNYADPKDYRRLCASCHRRADGIARNLR